MGDLSSLFESQFDSILSALTRSSVRESSISSHCVRVSGVQVINHAQEIVDCLERAVGLETVLNCKLQKFKNGGQYAIVQFKSEDSAVRCCRFSKKLTFKCNVLTIKPFRDPEGARMKQSMVSHIKDGSLHMGCLVKHNEMHVLCTLNPVNIEANNADKRLRVFFQCNDRVFKLEWAYNTFEDLNKCRFQGGSYFLLKVWTAPYVFEFDGGQQDFFSRNWINSLYFMEPTWVRSTDFTDGAYIAQSFVYCMELLGDQETALDSLLRDYLGSPLDCLSLVRGQSYSESQLIAPIVKSAHVGVACPFELIFAINSLVQHGYLCGPGVSERFYQFILSFRQMSINQIIDLLSEMRQNTDTCFDPENWIQSRAASFLRRWDSRVRFNRLEDGLVMVRRVYVTPCRVYFLGPQVDVSNRVTRHYAHCIDNFLCVSFVEEDFENLSPFALTHPRTNDANLVYKRIVSILRHGIKIGNKKFEFLAFSASQLRESSVWMFASDSSTSADKIRRWVGDFLSFTNVAKCAARMGQSFSSSTKSLDVHAHEVEMIGEILDHGYCFSDGIGKISVSFATEVAQKCKLFAGVPSLFQIRYAGYKGVVAIDPHSLYKLSLRPSMYKFSSRQVSLDILNWTHPIPSYLNRQIITLLSTLGVQDGVFEQMQGNVMHRLDDMLENRDVALDMLQTFCAGSSHTLMVELLSGWYNPSQEPFLMRMLYTFRAVQLMYLRKKTRIFTPKGRVLMGCLDETSSLDYGQVFVSVSPMPGSPHNFFNSGLDSVKIRGVNGAERNVCIVEGKVIVVKNPCVHPGDVRILNSVNIPALYHLVDCVVFPQRGARPHPSECSGSDLDGDLYFVSWDEQLIPLGVDPPMDYQVPEIKKLDHPVTVEDIQEHFVKFMMNNSLGVISNAHTVLADMRSSQARDEGCLKLAKLCSVAVDFPKTGIPAVLPADLRPSEYPDFMEKSNKPVYESKRVLGKLYRSVKDSKNMRLSSFTRAKAASCYDKELLIEGFEQYLEDAESLRDDYNRKLVEMMHDYDVKTEAEIVTGNILKLSKWYQKRPNEVKERIMRAMSSLKKETRRWFMDDDGEIQDGAYNLGPFSLQELGKASASYHVTYHPDYVDESAKPEYLLSFPWVVYDVLLAIKKAASERMGRWTNERDAK